MNCYESLPARFPRWIAGALWAVCLVALAGLVGSGCGSQPALVPQAARIDPDRGTFQLTAETRITAEERARETAEYLAERLSRALGREITVRNGRSDDSQNVIRLALRPDSASTNAESYTLEVDPRRVTLTAPDPAGLFYGAQTLLQLFRPEIFSPEPPPGVQWRAPCLRIEDTPRFPWRGLMLDVSRHFFNAGEVRQVIDGLAKHKLNRFHWHLTDDQGWRLEIKRYPRLTEVGAWRKNIGFGFDSGASTAYGPDGRYGGFYTQDEIRQVVQYAQARHVMIVPEIEMPGHATAALAAYPELSCTGGPSSTDAGAGIHEGVFCAGKEETFEFLENVLAEVMELFPGPYIHIGGDEVVKINWRECPKCQERIRREGFHSERELQSYFIRRIGQFIKSRGRIMVGWSEIREGGLPPSAVLMDWIGGAVPAATAGHDVVMTPVAHCYFDYPPTSNEVRRGVGPRAHLPLERVYAFEPIPARLPAQFHRRILGAQANVWTEYVPNFSRLEHLLYPRLCALAEVLWTPAPRRDWDDFSTRLETHRRRLRIWSQDPLPTGLEQARGVADRNLR